MRRARRVVDRRARGSSLPAVDDANARHARLERRAAGRQLRHHARRRGAARDQRVDPSEVERRRSTRPRSSSTPARPAGDHEIAAASAAAMRHAITSAFTFSTAPARRAVLDPEARDDRHVAVRRAAARRATDPAQPDRRRGRDRPSRRSPCGARSHRIGAAETGVHARQADGRNALTDERGDQLGVRRRRRARPRPRRASRASVTRSPSTFFGAIPRRSSSASIARPPPCTTTSGRVAAQARRRKAAMRAARRAAARAARRRA